MARKLGSELLWWCPSRDDAGYATTTLTDLSGNGFNGTLTSMDEATDWEVNTAAGGIRNLNFDGTDDLVLGSGSPAVGANSFWVSVWFYATGSLTTATSGARIFQTRGTGAAGSGVAGFQLKCYRSGGNVLARDCLFETGAGGNIYAIPEDTVIGSTLAWHHLFVKINRTTNFAHWWINGTYRGAVNGSTWSTGSMTTTRAAALGASSNTAYTQFFPGLIDDARIGSGEDTDEAIVTALWNGGNGRGYQPEPQYMINSRYGIAWQRHQVLMSTSTINWDGSRGNLAFLRLLGTTTLYLPTDQKVGETFQLVLEPNSYSIVLPDVDDWLEGITPTFADTPPSLLNFHKYNDGTTDKIVAWRSAV